MNIKKCIKKITVIILVLFNCSLVAQNQTDWKKLILKAKGNDLIKTHTIDKNILKSDEKVLDVNMIFYTKNYLLETDGRYHLVIPFYVSGAKIAVVLFREAIFQWFSEWNVINQDGIPVVYSCRVLKNTKKVKLKYWTKMKDSKDIELEEGGVYYLLGGNQELKQSLMQGKTNFLVLSQTKEEYERMVGSFFGILYSVYLLNSEEDYNSLMLYFM